MTQQDKQAMPSSAPNLVGIARVGAVAAAATHLANTASASAQDSNPTVVVALYLRGGADALTLCVPEDEPNYHAKRNKTRVYHHAASSSSVPAGNGKGILIEPAQMGPPNNSTILRTGFSVPPAFLPIKSLYDAGKLAFVHGVGCVDSNRSHFTQQSNSETGEHDQASPRDGDGWLGRYLSSTNARGDGSLRALAFNNFKITSFNSAAASTPARGITPTLEPQTFDMPGGADVRAHLTALYGSTSNAVSDALSDDLGAIDKLKNVAWGPPSPNYPSSTLGSQFDRAFRVIRDDAHIELITIDYDNISGQRWDSHSAQGVFSGTMANLMADLSNTLVAFQADVDTLEEKRVVVIVYSEFGRTLDENDGEGTDHGRGGIAMVMGNDVRTKQVFTHPTDWRGLQSAHLDPPMTGDLKQTVDIRDIQAEVLQKCLGASPNAIFPDSTYSYTDWNLLS